MLRDDQINLLNETKELLYKARNNLLLKSEGNITETIFELNDVIFRVEHNLVEFKEYPNIKHL